MDSSVNQFQPDKLIFAALIVCVVLVVMMLLLNKTRARKTNNLTTGNQGINL